MAGESIWPKPWLEKVQRANRSRVDLREAANDLIDRGLKNGTVGLSKM